jgi:hypothetical protein
MVFTPQDVHEVLPETANPLETANLKLSPLNFMKKNFLSKICQ